MQVTHGGPIPVYQQIAAIIRERIETGRATGLAGDRSYPPGKPIPSIERIRQETGVTVKTIQHAIRILTAEGLVEVVSGIGTFVTRQEGDQ